MPTRFLSDAEIERLEGWPEAIDQPDLVRYFDLDGDDLEFVRRQHGPPAQLGVALQLCALRWLGFVPEDLTDAPPEAIGVLAGVLDVSPRVIFEYAVRPQTVASIGRWCASTLGSAPALSRSSMRWRDG